MSRHVATPGALLTVLALVGPAHAQAPEAVREPALEQLTFDEAVERAMTRNPNVGEASQAILKAQALLDDASSVFLPFAYGSVATTVLDDARGFDDNIVQPRTQTAFSVTVSYALFDAHGADTPRTTWSLPARRRGKPGSTSPWSPRNTAGTRSGAHKAPSGNGTRGLGSGRSGSRRLAQCSSRRWLSATLP